MSRTARSRGSRFTIRDRRISFLAVGLLSVGGMVLLTQGPDSASAAEGDRTRGVSANGCPSPSASPSENRRRQAQRQDPRCATPPAGTASPGAGQGTDPTAAPGNRQATDPAAQPGDPAAQPGDPAAQPGDPAAQPGGQPGDPAASPTATVTVSGDAPDPNQVPETGAPGPTPVPIQGDGANAAPPASQLQILGNSCENSQLQAHDGFQRGNRCVSTEFGEVGNAATNPSLLIASAPRQVRVGQAFNLTVSTRNLVRDRFLAAGQGGYYLESSFLNGQGLVRGHFHTACRMLNSNRNAPDPAPAPAFFVATEDGGGGGAPDTVTIRVTGLPSRGMAQCAVWAGDGSHRVPMMERANQVPAFDVVRVAVR